MEPFRGTAVTLARGLVLVTTQSDPPLSMGLGSHSIGSYQVAPFSKDVNSVFRESKAASELEWGPGPYPVVGQKCRYWKPNLAMLTAGQCDKFNGISAG